jgi:alkylation response protein AidB-like acyl-CoA dehydrogenase
MERAPTLLLSGALFEACQAFFEPRAGAVDRGEADFRDAAPFLFAEILGGEAAPPDDPNRDLPAVSRALATVGWFDMASAFSLWCQRMVVEYLSRAPRSSAAFSEALPAVLRGERLGSTGLAGPMAHFVSGAPLVLRAERDGDGYRVSGFVPWASNLAEGATIIVTAAARDDGEGPVVFATPIEGPGLQIGQLEPLIAMQGTLSTSITFDRTPVPREWVVSEDFPAFMAGVRPVFLLLQSSYCWGLAARCIHEAGTSIRGVAEVFRDELAEAERRLSRLATALSEAAACRCEGVGMPNLLEARIEAAHLAVEAASLEARIAGGRSYIATCDTARRLREALFLPVQAPTEGQLRWERSRYA